MKGCSGLLHEGWDTPVLRLRGGPETVPFSPVFIAFGELHVLAS